jgi:hypothetical protein
LESLKEKFEGLWFTTPIVMAGRDPAIQRNWQLIGLPKCRLDARIKSGHDDF